MRFGPGRLVTLLAAASCLVLAACGDDDDRVPVLDTSPTQPPRSEAPTTTIDNGKPAVSLPAELPTELVVTDLIEGTGEPAKKGDTITVNYVGVRSEDGTEFDNSYDRGQPYTITLGEGGVIEGWDEGLIGVKAGGQRQLDIPASLAYGDVGAGDVIKPGDALTFVIDVVSVTPAPVPPTLAPMADPADCPAPDGSSEKQQEFTEYPPTCIDITKGYTAEIETNMGSLTVELYPGQAPLAVNSFVVLCARITTSTTSTATASSRSSSLNAETRRARGAAVPATSSPTSCPRKVNTRSDRWRWRTRGPTRTARSSSSSPAPTGRRCRPITRCSVR